MRISDFIDTFSDARCVGYFAVFAFGLSVHRPQDASLYMGSLRRLPQFQAQTALLLLASLGCDIVGNIHCYADSTIVLASGADGWFARKHAVQDGCAAGSSTCYS